MTKLESRALNRIHSLKYAKQTHEIARYAPDDYDSKGRYKKNEWLNYWDIGRIFNHKRFTLKQYLLTEDNFIHAAEDIIKQSHISFLTVAYLEIGKPVSFDKNLSIEMVNLLKSLHVGKRLNVHQSVLLMRIILRGMAWGILVNESKKFQVSFGYDYYMNIHTNIPYAEILDIVHRNNLYIDPRNVRR